MIARQASNLFRVSQLSRIQIKDIQQESQWNEFVVNNKKPVIIDFYADWCRPCKMLGPHLQKHAEASNDQFDVIKVNIDNHGELADQYKVTSIPAVFLVHKGKTIDKFLGLNEEKLNGFADLARQLAKQ